MWVLKFLIKIHTALHNHNSKYGHNRSGLHPSLPNEMFLFDTDISKDVYMVGVCHKSLSVPLFRWKIQICIRFFSLETCLVTSVQDCPSPQAGSRNIFLKVLLRYKSVSAGKVIFLRQPLAFWISRGHSLFCILMHWFSWHLICARCNESLNGRKCWICLRFRFLRCRDVLLNRFFTQRYEMSRISRPSYKWGLQYEVEVDAQAG